MSWAYTVCSRNTSPRSCDQGSSNRTADYLASSPLMINFSQYASSSFVTDASIKPRFGFRIILESFVSQVAPTSEISFFSDMELQSMVLEYCINFGEMISSAVAPLTRVTSLAKSFSDFKPQPPLRSKYSGYVTKHAYKL